MNTKDYKNASRKLNKFTRDSKIYRGVHRTNSSFNRFKSAFEELRSTISKFKAHFNQIKSETAI